MKAVLLAAGKGSRLGSLTERFPKPLIQVGGEPIIDRILHGLTAAGVHDFTVITGHASALLSDHLGDGSRYGASIRCIEQQRLDGTARALELSRPHLEGEPFFVGWGDIVVDGSNYARVISAANTASAVLAVNEVDDPYAGGAVYVDSAMAVTRLVEKPPRGSSTTRWNNAGLCILPPEVWPFIDQLEPSVRGEYELPQAIAAMIASGVPTRAVPIAGPWFDIGTPESLAAAGAHFGQ